MTIQELLYYVCPEDIWRSWYISVILLNLVISLQSFMDILLLWRWQFFFSKLVLIASHFISWFMKDLIYWLKDFHLRLWGKTISFQKKNAILYILSFLVSFFFTHILCGIVYKEKKEQFKPNVVKNKGSFKHKMQKSDLIISKAWKASHMNECQVTRTPSRACSSMDKYWLSTSYVPDTVLDTET